MLGEGGFATVTKGLLGERTVAVKALKEARHRDIFREVWGQVRFSHPHLLTCLGLTNESPPRIVLEFAAYGASVLLMLRGLGLGLSRPQ